MVPAVPSAAAVKTTMGSTMSKSIPIEVVSTRDENITADIRPVVSIIRPRIRPLIPVVIIWRDAALHEQRCDGNSHQCHYSCHFHVLLKPIPFG